ncbi:MAG: hypothetical protein WC632_04640 [Candidatus Margulisiibacteriota bacterium]
MPIQEPITVLTNLPILIFSLYCFNSLRQKPSPASLFAASFLFLALMTLCGTLYHINNYTFFTLQKYGTMIFGGLFSASLGLAALFDNFKPKTARVLAGLPIASFIFYLLAIRNNSFLPFILLQLFNILIIFFAYLQGWPGRKTLFIYGACLAFILAGLVQTQPVKFLAFNNNDLFHIVALASIALLYLGLP